ncbi:MAG: LysR family transcriptional regulator [Gammaproteobacteria bacterium]|nr:MAG: LysR family transcriptional regulator [Gammaproteobacteria bacterium]
MRHTRFKEARMIGQLHDIDLKLLRIFKAVVEAGGLSAAEVTLNMNVSNISTRLADLEKRLGVRLCDRGRQGFALTDAGHQVYTAILELMESLDRFRCQVQVAGQTVTGELRLMLTDNTLDDRQFPIVKIIERYRARAPDVQIRLEHGSQTEVEQHLVSGAVQLGITSLSQSLDTLDCRYLYAEDTFLYCGPSHPLFECALEELSVPRIEQFGFIDTAAGEHSAVPIKGVRQTAVAPSLEARAALILTGGYLGFLPSHYAQRWIDSGEMRVLLPSKMHYRKKMYLIAKKGRQYTPAEALFIEQLQPFFPLENGG